MSDLPHSTTSSSKPTQTETNPEKTVVVTENPTSEPKEDDNSGGGPNVAGIAAGVVVAIVVVAALIGGGFIYMRRKRNLELEEEHRRNAAVSAFIGNKPRSIDGSSSMADSRMDPVMAHRRMSDGSIADNEDYSRRILRVCLALFCLPSSTLFANFAPGHQRINATAPVITTKRTRPLLHF